MKRESSRGQNKKNTQKNGREDSHCRTRTRIVGQRHAKKLSRALIIIKGTWRKGCRTFFRSRQFTGGACPVLIPCTAAYWKQYSGSPFYFSTCKGRRVAKSSPALHRSPQPRQEEELQFHLNILVSLPAPTCSFCTLAISAPL